MSDAHFAPHPWDWTGSGKPGSNGLHNIYVIDLNGRKIAAVWGKEDNQERIWTASLLAEAPGLYRFAEREAAKGNAEAQYLLDEIAQMVANTTQAAA